MVKKKGAEWHGSWYKRKRSNDWRNRNSDIVKKTPTGRTLGKERKGLNFYGKDTPTRRKNFIRR